MSLKVMVEVEDLVNILAKSCDPWPGMLLPERRACIRRLLESNRPDGAGIGRTIRHIQRLDRIHSKCKSQPDCAAYELLYTLSPPMDWDGLEAWFEANDQTN